MAAALIRKLSWQHALTGAEGIGQLHGPTTRLRCDEPASWLSLGLEEIPQSCFVSSGVPCQDASQQRTCERNWAGGVELHQTDESAAASPGGFHEVGRLPGEPAFWNLELYAAAGLVADEAVAGLDPPARETRDARAIPSPKGASL